MRRRLFSRRAALFLFAAVPASLSAQGTRLEVGGATFLLVPVGARAAALGQAAVADGGTTESAFWNPAGLALARNEIAVYYASTFASRNTALSGVLTSSRLGVIALSAYLVDYGSQEAVTGPGQQTGITSPKNIELIGSYATQVVGSLTLGVNYKLIQFRQDCTGDCGVLSDFAGTTHAVDLGLQYGIAGDALRLGFVVRHAGFDLQIENREQADPLPTRLQIGAAYRIRFPGRTDSERFDLRVLLDLHDSWGEYGSPDASLGLDFGLADVIRVRSGYALLRSESRGPSLGVALRIDRVSAELARVFFDAGSLDEPVHLALRIAL